jgi:hypothetical protein
MFKEQEKAEYFNTKAPTELKNRTRLAIQKKKSSMAKKRRVRIVAVACCACMLIVTNVMYQNSTVIKINDVPVSYLDVTIKSETENIPSTISVARNVEPHSVIPMEIEAKGKTNIKVSEGRIYTKSNEVDLSERFQELNIQKSDVIYWEVDVNTTTATCIVTTEKKEYRYVIVNDESGCKIKLKQSK